MKFTVVTTKNAYIANIRYFILERDEFNENSEFIFNEKQPLITRPFSNISYIN